MDTPLSIRSADTEDINAIGFLAQQIWPAAYGQILPPGQLEYMLNLIYSPASLRKQMLEDRQQFLLVEDEEEEEPIGFASYSELEEPAFPRGTGGTVSPGSLEGAGSPSSPGGGGGSGASFGSGAGTGVFKLHKIYVLPGRQGKGLGKTLLDFVLEDIRSRGAVSLQLNVNRHNKARSFYERMGFVVIREEDIDIGQGYYMNDYVMEKTLG